MEVLCGREEGHRALAASVQLAWGRVLVALVEEILRETEAAEQVEGLVLSGGCALNVVVNQELEEKLQKRRNKKGEPVGEKGCVMAYSYYVIRYIYIYHNISYLSYSDGRRRSLEMSRV